MLRAVRRGFTLVEVLVIIAIIAVLAAILIPAIHAARKAAMERQAKAAPVEVEPPVALQQVAAELPDDENTIEAEDPTKPHVVWSESYSHPHITVWLLRLPDGREVMVGAGDKSISMTQLTPVSNDALASEPK